MDARDIDFIEGYLDKKYLLLSKTRWRSYVLIVFAILAGSGVGHFVVYQKAQDVATDVVKKATEDGTLQKIKESRQRAEENALAVENSRKRAEETVQFLEQRKSEQENFKNELQKLSTDTQQQAQQAFNQSSQALARKLVLGEEKELAALPDCKPVEVVLGPAKDNSFAFITYVMGKFEGGGERVWIEKRSDSWVLCASACQKEVMVKARCAWIE